MSRLKDKEGYVYKFQPEHPYRNTQNCVRQHRLVMERWLRENDPTNPSLIEIGGVLYLRREAVVHHINEIKDDNRKDNLRLFANKGDHAGFHKKKHDTLRRKKGKNRHTHPFISTGNKSKTLLNALYMSRDERFNVKNYYRISGVPRSTIYSMLDTLIKKGFVIKHNVGNYRITNKGTEYLQLAMSSTPSRSECRDSIKNMSMHYIKYKLLIKDKTKFSESRISELNPIRWKPLELRNQRILYIYFEDSTVIIHPKCVLIRIHDILAENAEEAEIMAFNKAMKHIIKLNKIGLQEQSISLDSAHFARVKSILSEFLGKIDDKYFLDLGDKKKFWIDTSNENQEDETNDIIVRKRVDQAMQDIMKNDIDLTEIKEQRKILGMITKNLALLTVAEMKKKEPVSKPNEIIERPGYIG